GRVLAGLRGGRAIIEAEIVLGGEGAGCGGGFRGRLGRGRGGGGRGRHHWRCQAGAERDQRAHEHDPPPDGRLQSGPPPDSYHTRPRKIASRLESPTGTVRSDDLGRYGDSATEDRCRFAPY